MSNPDKNTSEHEMNNQAYFTWLFEKYNFSNGDRVLELACGEGEQWENRIPNSITLLLSDKCDDNVRCVTNKFAGYIGKQLNPEPRVIDMQNIDEPSLLYDIIIANRALYMCDDMQKALTEIKRVLKPRGTFFTSTRWYSGRNEYLGNLVNTFIDMPSNPSNDFTLQNGSEILTEHFSYVKQYEYDDSLHSSRIEDFRFYFQKQYKYTIKKHPSLETDVTSHIKNIIDKEGCIHIPSVRGFFIAKK